MPKSQEELGRGKYLQLVREHGWEFARRVNATGVVAVVAVTGDWRMVLTDQFRPAVRARVIDLPAGLVGDSAGQETEAAELAAERELCEETGFHASSLRRLGMFPTSPGLTDETVTLYLAEQVRQVETGGGVDGEAITVHTPRVRDLPEQLQRWQAEGCLIDPKVYVGLFYFIQECGVLEPQGTGS